MFAVLRRSSFWATAREIVTDMPLTHWMPYFLAQTLRLAGRWHGQFNEGTKIRPHTSLVEAHSVSLDDRLVLRAGAARRSTRGGSGSLVEGYFHICGAGHRFTGRDLSIINTDHDPTGEVLIQAEANIGRHTVKTASSVVTRDVLQSIFWAAVPVCQLNVTGGINHG